MLARIAKLLRIQPPVVEDEGLLFASGATVPTDAAAGYQTGCLFQHTDGAEGTAMYLNEGTSSSCDFNAIAALTATQEALIGATAGTVTASKAVIVDSSKNIAGFGTVGCGALTATGGIVMAGAEGIGLSILTSTPTDGINIAANCANAIVIGGANTGHAIDIGSTWGVGITGAAISIGDYSNAIAFGTISDHLIAQVINVSCAVDDDSNIIPMHVAFTNTADCGANSVAQVVYARATLAYAISDCYALRARTDITDATNPTLNMVTGVFSTLTTKACEIAATGMLAAIIGTVDGTEDITTVGYGKVCGAYIFWNQTNAMTADTAGIYVAVNAGATLDSGYRINAAGSLTNSFHSHNSSGTPTNVLNVEGAHTNLLALPAEGTAPCVTTAWSAAGADAGTVVKIAITIGGSPYFILASTAPTGS